MNDQEQLSIFSDGEPKPRKEKMKVSKVVLIVVALHVLVIGGFLLFEAFNREAPAQPELLSENESIPARLREPLPMSTRCNRSTRRNRR